MKFDANVLVIVFAVLFGISESLAVIPQVKANSVYQLIRSIIASLAGKSPSP